VCSRPYQNRAAFDLASKFLRLLSSIPSVHPRYSMQPGKFDAAVEVAKTARVEREGQVRRWEPTKLNIGVFGSRRVPPPAHGSSLSADTLHAFAALNEVQPEHADRSSGPPHLNER
jgi:hypothetical protein